MRSYRDHRLCDVTSSCAYAGDYSQQFVKYNETGIDISLTVTHHHKFHNLKKNNCALSAGMFFSLTAITAVMSIFRMQQRLFFHCVCWPQRSQRLEDERANAGFSDFLTYCSSARDGHGLGRIFQHMWWVGLNEKYCYFFTALCVCIMC